MPGYLFLVSPDGMASAWVHPLDRSTGNYPQYDAWVDATGLNDADFEALVTRLQRAN
ncbi:hypothetical protein [Pararobbsia silviterrae]|uniref:hypothetical protein n=1 Tax=Pararobbsia silviterrae TaxID=1792498 RepID=UPI001314381A|nr:hypothetical protein [Pararobbsia silviterrae]